MTIKTNFDYNLRKWYLKYKVANHEIISYLDEDASNDQYKEWKRYHFEIARDLALKFILEYDNRQTLHNSI